MKFRKSLMLERIEKEGLIKGLSAEDMQGVMEIMDNLDGQPVTASSWSRQVKDEPVYSCLGKDGRYYDVYEGDCV